jgi:hypothetical protein
MKCPKCGRDPHPDGVGNLCVECGLPITCPSCKEHEAAARAMAESWQDQWCFSERWGTNPDSTMDDYDCSTFDCDKREFRMKCPRWIRMVEDRIAEATRRARQGKG